MSFSFRTRWAFTLLEVCLVMAIIVLLVIALIPAFITHKPLKLTPESAPKPTPELSIQPTPVPHVAPETPR